MASFIKVLRPGVYNIAVRAKPGSKVTSFASVANSSDEALEVYLAAPPVEGQANKELVDFMQSILKTGLRELRYPILSPENFLSPTSHTLNSTFTNAPVMNNIIAKDRTSSSSKKTKGKGNNKPKCSSKISDSNDKKEATSATEKASLLPNRVAVRLARGTTSRSKLLEVEFPGSEWELVCLLEKASG
ncbi:unnamed protein product [Phytomonas sp. Hart1]|nr:unnamed protein product [Phytomonas sp. Hart1]|eukprot:CCW66610.1 unnamed protein product [Phytomonas sp. isolate Hart1]